MLTSWRDDHLTEPERPGSLADGAGGWTGGWAVASTAHWENILDTSGQTESCSKTTVHRPPLGAGADIENIGRSVGGGGGWGKNEFNIGFIRILPEPWWFFCFLVLAWGPFNLREKQWFSAVNLEHLEQTFRPSKMLMLIVVWYDLTLLYTGGGTQCPPLRFSSLESSRVIWETPDVGTIHIW